MKKVLAILVMVLVCQGAFASDAGDYYQWATGGGYAAEYWGTFESDFNGYQQLGATMSAGTVYEIRPVFKFDISGLDVGDLVGAGKITFLHEGGILAESDDVMIESFQSTEIAASFSDFFSAPATASKVAFAANEMGVYDDNRYYLIEVDINDWLQSAVDNGEDVFSVRLSTPYLLEAGAMDGKPLPYVRYLGPVGTGLKPGVLAYSVVPETTLLEGDANRDGVVSAGDYASVQANFGATGTPGILGDANGDGVVSAGDYASVQSNFGNTAGAGIVPEPTMMAMMALGGLAGLKRRQHKFTVVQQ